MQVVLPAGAGLLGLTWRRPWTAGSGVERNPLLTLNLPPPDTGFGGGKLKEGEGGQENGSA